MEIEFRVIQDKIIILDINTKNLGQYNFRVLDRKLLLDDKNIDNMLKFYEILKFFNFVFYGVSHHYFVDAEPIERRNMKIEDLLNRFKNGDEGYFRDYSTFGNTFSVVEIKNFKKIEKLLSNVDMNEIIKERQTHEYIIDLQGSIGYKNSIKTISMDETISCYGIDYYFFGDIFSCYANINTNTTYRPDLLNLITFFNLKTRGKFGRMIENLTIGGI